MRNIPQGLYFAETLQCHQKYYFKPTLGHSWECYLSQSEAYHFLSIRSSLYYSIAEVPTRPCLNQVGFEFGQQWYCSIGKQGLQYFISAWASKYFQHLELE